MNVQLKRGDSRPRIAVLGAGLIGQRHAQIISTRPEISLAGLVDPSPIAGKLCSKFSCEVFADLNLLMDKVTQIDGVIIATPNNTHLELSKECINRGIPVLVEKPLAINASEAREIYEQAVLRDTPVLVGHHRRYHEASQKTKKLVSSGKLGKLIAGQVTWCLRKPNSYFEQGSWRSQSGGGPVWINLIHEIDLLRFFFGEVESVSAMTSNSVRRYDVEDTAAILLRFENEVLVTVLISDAAPSPWHFEGASGENPNIAQTGQDGMRLMGTKAALEFPSLTLWQHPSGDNGDWGKQIDYLHEEQSSMGDEFALNAQIEHFIDVIENRCAPIVSASDGLNNILVTEAILKSSQTGKTVTMADQVN